jgi:uncharacterized membrane protein YhaH (DUF805 family)
MHVGVTGKGMGAFRFLFSPAGRLDPRSFISGAIGVYLVGVGSQLLTTADVARRAGLLPYVAVQFVLIWTWYCLHGKRLRDAGRSSGLAVGVGLLYLLSVVLLLIVTDSFMPTSDQLFGNADAVGALWLTLLIYVVSILGGSGQYDLVPVVVAILIVFAFLPIVIALAVTAWAARLKSQPPGADSK